MKRESWDRRLPHHHAMSVAALIAMGCSLDIAFALPQGEKVVAGEVGFSRPGATSLLIRQRSGTGIVNWGGFSIDRGERVQIQQPQASSVLLNRVAGSDPSRIFGQLSANGRVFLLNPNGVLFGAGSQVNVGSLVASTLSISDEDFLAGRYRFTGNGGAVANEGRITAAERGTVALLGGSVRNDGQVEARLGTVALAAGSEMTLDLAGDGLSRIVVSRAAIDAQVANGGAIVADGGAVLMTASAVEAMVGDAVSHSGLIRARSLVEREGRIVLDGGDRGRAIVSGIIDATGDEAATRGGEVRLLGHQVGVTGSAVVDASGQAGGGTVLVGGDLHGQNADVRNAGAAYVGPRAMLRADATERGDGGRIVVWADGVTRMHGMLSARGGPLGGNGGLVETSGKSLDTSGARVNASAPKGHAGQWLLDPVDVSIENGPQGGSQSVTDSPNFESIYNSDATSVVTSGDIEAALNNGTSVTISTALLPNDTGQLGDISIASGTNILKDDPIGGDATLTLNALRHIVGGGGGSSIVSTAGRLNVDFNSNSGGGTGTGAIDLFGLRIVSNGGDVRMYGASDPVNGRAQGDSSVLNGISLLNTTIDTVPAGGGVAGSITMRGTGRTGAAGSAGGAGTAGVGSGSGGPGAAGAAGGAGGSGVVLSGVNLVVGSGRINVDGIAGDGGAGGSGGVGGSGGSPGCSSEFCSSAPGGPGGNGGVGGAGGVGGVGVAIDGASVLSTSSGAIDLRGIGGIAGTGGSGGGGGTGGNGQIGIPAGSAVGGAGGNAGAGAAAGAAGAGIVIAGATMIVGSGGIVVNSTAGNGAVGGAGALGGGGGTGAAAAGGVAGAPSSGGPPSAGAPGLYFQSSASGSILQLAGGTVVIAATGGAGGAGSPQAAAATTASSGGDGGAGILAAGSIKLDGTGSVSWVGAGGAGGAGGNALPRRPGDSGGNGGAGGDGGAGSEHDGVTQAGAVDFTVRGTGAAGGKGGDAGSAGSGGTGGHGVSVSGGSIAATTGDIDLFGVGGAGGPRSSVVTAFVIGDSVVLGSSPAIGSEGVNGDGVLLGSASGTVPTLGTESGNILVFGRASSSSELRSATGLRLSFATVMSTAGGNIDLRGRSEASESGLLNVGVRSSNSDIATSGGPGRILISGETTSGSYGVRIEEFDSSDLTVGGSATSGDIVIRALNDGSGDSIDLATAVLQTTGRVNLRPGGVSAAGALTAADAVPITIANPVIVGESEVGPAGFALRASDLESIQSGAAGVVIGSDTHTGAIAVELAFPWQHPLTLQNGGAGSQGIRIASTLANPGRSVTLSSGGAVTQAAGASITAGSLLLHGTQPTSTFDLSDPANNVARLASRFEAPADPTRTDPSSVNYVNSGQLTIGPATVGGPAPAGIGFDTASNVPIDIVAERSTAGGDFTARTLAGNLRLTHGITTLGSDITLVTPGIFDNAGLATLVPGGNGRWSIWASTWIGETRGGLAASTPTPSVYGCTYGAASCASGAVQPSTGNHYFYVERPTVTVTPNPLARPYGSPNPMFTATLSGVLTANGDTAADAFDGTLSTSATASSPIGDYPITVSPLASPAGYQVDCQRCTLTVNPAPLTIAADNKLKLAGTPNPELTATFSGFVLGDTPATAEAAGFRLRTPAQTLSPPGAYPILADPFDMANYAIRYIAGTMAVLPPGQLENPTRAMASETSDLYERNFGLPPMCFAGSASVIERAPLTVDALSIEWSRVRQKPNIANCVGLGQRNECDSF